MSKKSITLRVELEDGGKFMFAIGDFISGCEISAMAFYDVFGVEEVYESALSNMHSNKALETIEAAEKIMNENYKK